MLPRHVAAFCGREGESGVDTNGSVNGLRSFGLATALALALGGGLVGVSAATSSKPRALAAASSAASGPTVRASASTRALLAGIPQHSTLLGRADAPVTMVEFADLQCPYCGEFARDTLPVLIRRYVRPGKLRIDFRGVSIVGPDSATALRVAQAAGLQNRLWNVVELLYENQGTENTGWVSDPLLRVVALRAGADPAFVFSRLHDARVDAQLQLAAQEANRINLPGTPYFALGRTGQQLQVLQERSLAPSEFESAIEALLG